MENTHIRHFMDICIPARRCLSLSYALAGGEARTSADLSVEKYSKLLHRICSLALALFYALARVYKRSLPLYFPSRINMHVYEGHFVPRSSVTFDVSELRSYNAACSHQKVSGPIITFIKISNNVESSGMFRGRIGIWITRLFLRKKFFRLA